MTQLCVVGLTGMPRVQPGDDLVSLIADALQRNNVVPQAQDVVVVAQKIVSKAENRYVRLADVEPGSQAAALSLELDKDARLVEVILNESEQVLRSRPGLLIVRHRLGFVMANAGVDQSNLDSADDERVLLLPQDPQRSANLLREGLEARFGVRLGVIVNDSAGRPWRNGIIGVALGASGLPVVRDMCGREDLNGRTLKVTFTGFADAIAAAASLAMGEANEGVPAAVVSGLDWPSGEISPAGLLREPELDLFL